MYADLKNYKPSEVEYVISEEVKDFLPQTLDFTQLEGVGIKSSIDAINFVGDNLIATFPQNECVMRKLDDFEIHAIREEYCVKQENEVPKRKMNLEETLERIKLMKKQAEEAYNAILEEVSQYAAEVKKGTREVMLSNKETFCIALAGYYAIYTYDKERKLFVLAKAFPIPDRSELWASESENAKRMNELFGLEFPEVKKPEDESDDSEDSDDDLPFGDEGEE